jgi:hypothetical protein
MNETRRKKAPHFCEANLPYQGGRRLELATRRKVAVPLRCEVQEMESIIHGRTPPVKCHSWHEYHPSLVNRRSFCAVGESCVTNLIPDPKPIRSFRTSVELGHDFWSRRVLKGAPEYTLPKGGKGGSYNQKRSMISV